MNKQSSVTGALVAMASERIDPLRLTNEAIKNLKLWWEGQISGKRCAKNIIDASAAVLAGLGGGVGGAAIGALAGPVGAVIGGTIGTIVSAVTAGALVDQLTKTIFDLPKDVATEKAYYYFGLSQSASNQDINEAYRRLCLQHHPDKRGGSAEKFLELQSNMGIIKMHRGEM